MAARFDHLVVAVEDLDEAAARWCTAGLPAEHGGAHPVGTVNALVRGPGPAYVELIAAGSEESNPWLDRVRWARGPISWAIAVDDIEQARTSLVAVGFAPSPALPGSRRTPDGDLLEWQVCDLGDGPYDGSLPFLIEWTTPMEPGPADGPVVEQVSLTPPDPDQVADLLLALGLEPEPLWPRRIFEDATGVRLTVAPVGPPADRGESSWTMSWEEPIAPPVSLALRTASGELVHHTLAGVDVVAWPDRRRLAASALQPTGGADDCRSRARAWVDVIVAEGLAAAQSIDVEWAAPITVDEPRAVRLAGPVGTQPITVVWGTHPDDGDLVVVGIGDPVEVLEQQPAGPRPESRARQIGHVDDAFVHALSGGVYAVRGARRSVVRLFNGVRSDGLFSDGEAEQWLADADAGRRTDGVVAGDSWV